MWPAESIQPAEALVYFSTDSGASLGQSGFSSAGLQVLPQETNFKYSVIKNPNYSWFFRSKFTDYYNHFIRFRNDDNYARVTIVKSSGSIKRLKVFSQIPSIRYLFLLIHIIIAKLDQMYITKVFSLCSMMEILIQRIGPMITDHMILTGIMPKSPRGIISMT